MGVNVLKLRSQIREYLKGKNKLFLKESSINLAKVIFLKKNELSFPKLCTGT